LIEAKSLEHLKLLTATNGFALMRGHMSTGCRIKYDWTGKHIKNQITECLRKSSDSRGYKLSKTYCATTTRYWLFTQRVINIWNNLSQDIVDFRFLASFQRTVKLVDFSANLKLFVQ